MTAAGTSSDQTFPSQNGSALNDDAYLLLVSDTCFVVASPSRQQPLLPSFKSRTFECPVRHVCVYF